MVDFPLVTGTWSTEYDLLYRTCINLYPCGKLDLTSLVSPFCRHDFFKPRIADIAPKGPDAKAFPRGVGWRGPQDLVIRISFSMRDGNLLGFNTPNAMMMYHQPESLVHHFIPESLDSLKLCLLYHVSSFTFRHSMTSSFIA